jgi:DeoR/GlpR family transcriptional regulator of sugar metabolism
MLIERHNAILELARQMGRVSVDDLGEKIRSQSADHPQRLE